MSLDPDDALATVAGSAALMPPVLQHVFPEANVDLFRPEYAHLHQHWFQIGEYRIPGHPLLLKERSFTLFRELAHHRAACFAPASQHDPPPRYLEDEQFGTQATPRFVALQLVWNYLNALPLPANRSLSTVEHLLIVLHCVAFIDYFGADSMRPKIREAAKKLLVECSSVNATQSTTSLSNALHPHAWSGTLMQWTLWPEWATFHHWSCRASKWEKGKLAPCTNWCPKGAPYCAQHTATIPVVRDISVYRSPTETAQPSASSDEWYYVTLGQGIVGKFNDALGRASRLDDSDCALLGTFNRPVEFDVLSETALRNVMHAMRTNGAELCRWKKEKTNTHAVDEVVVKEGAWYVMVPSIPDKPQQRRWIRVREAPPQAVSASAGLGCMGPTGPRRSTGRKERRGNVGCTGPRGPRGFTGCTG